MNERLWWTFVNERRTGWVDFFNKQSQIKLVPRLTLRYGGGAET